MTTGKLIRMVVEPGKTLAVVAVLLCARASLADHYRVPSGSMMPTIEIGDHLLVDKRAYGLRIPATQHYMVQARHAEPGDVVVLDSPVDERVLLKRVAAVAGQRVEVKDGQLIVNGVATSFQCDATSCLERLGASADPHHIRVTGQGGATLGPVVIPQGQVLVMGDNRGESYDGRYFGFVDEGRLLGRAVGVFFRNGAPAWEKL